MAISETHDATRSVALAEELGAQLRRLKGAGPKITQFLSMVQLDRGAGDESPLPALGALPDGAGTVPFGCVRRVIEHDLDARMRDLFSEFDEEPFAIALNVIRAQIWRNDSHVAQLKEWTRNVGVERGAAR